MAGDAATNAASSARPSEEQLAQIDRPAEDNTWHEAPAFSKANWKQQAQGVFKKKKADGSSGTAADGTATAATAVPVEQHGAPSAAGTQGPPPSGVEVGADAKEASQKKTNEYQAKLKAYLSKKMPQERRDQTVWRLKVSTTHPYLMTLSLTKDRKWLSNANNTRTISVLSPHC
jgi:hypothetical protein